LSKQMTDALKIILVRIDRFGPFKFPWKNWPRLIAAMPNALSLTAHQCALLTACCIPWVVPLVCKFNVYNTLKIKCGVLRGN